MMLIRLPLRPENSNAGVLFHIDDFEDIGSGLQMYLGASRTSFLLPRLIITSGIEIPGNDDAYAYYIACSSG